MMGEIVEMQVTAQLTDDDRSVELVERWFVYSLHSLVGVWAGGPGEAAGRVMTPERLGTLELGPD